MEHGEEKEPNIGEPLPRSRENENDVVPGNGGEVTARPKRTPYSLRTAGLDNTYRTKAKDRNKEVDMKISWQGEI